MSDPNPPLSTGNAWCYTSDIAPTALDSEYMLPVLWETPDGTVWICTDNTSANAKWQNVSPVKAWANFDGNDGDINASMNIASIVRNSTGNYTLTFTWAMSDSNYAISITTTGSNVVGSISSLSSSTCTILTDQITALGPVAIDPTKVTVTVMR